MNDPLLRFAVIVALLAALCVCLLMSIRKPKPPRTEELARHDARAIGDGAWAADPRASSYTQARYPASRANRRAAR